MRSIFYGVTKLKSGAYVVHIHLLGRLWHVKSCSTAEEAALWWDIATMRLNVFRKNKTASRAHLNFPDKIEEHMGNFEDDKYPGMRARIGALWHRLTEIKISATEKQKHEKLHWDRVLEVIARLEQQLTDHEARLAVVENKILQNKNL